VTQQFSVWAASPAHKREKVHRCEEVKWNAMGVPPYILCECGWRDTGSDTEMERAYANHRKELGLPCALLSINTPLAGRSI
jgi:hypothetical protein